MNSRRESGRERSLRHALYHPFQISFAAPSFFFFLSIRQACWREGSMSSRAVSQLSSLSVAGSVSFGCRMVVQLSELCVACVENCCRACVGWFGVV